MKILKSKKLITVLAMLLMVATVVGMGTMTYSRYVTSKGMENPESATVADWGYVLSIDASKMFGDAYEENEVAVYTADGLDVKAAATAKKLVAPGTGGSMTITVSGNAEVLAKFAIAVEDATKDVVLVYKTTAGGAESIYNPIKWTLSKNGAAVAAATNTTLDAIVTYLANNGDKIEVGASVQTVYTLSWAWDINDSEEVNDATNKMDTALGMLAAEKSVEQIEAATGLIVVKGEGKTNTNLSVQISASIIQIQD